MMLTTLLLATALTAAPCTLPIYLTDGTTRCAEAPATFAFGRVVFLKEGRTVTLPASVVSLLKTQPIHERARKAGGSRGGFSLAKGEMVQGPGFPPPIPERAQKATPPTQARDVPSRRDVQRVRSELARAKQQEKAAGWSAVGNLSQIRSGNRREVRKGWRSSVVHGAYASRVKRLEAELAAVEARRKRVMSP